MAFSHKDGASVEVSTNVNNISGNPTKMPDDMKQASFKYGSDESAKLAGVFKLPFGIQCQNQMQIADASCKNVMKVFVATKEFCVTPDTTVPLYGDAI